MGFNQPAGGGVFFRPADHNGNLILVIEAFAEETRYDDMRKGDVRDVTVDLVDLDADEPEILGGVVLSHKGLTRHVKVGDTMVLGRIGTVETKKGTAYVLNRFTEEDAAQAEKWVENNKTRPTFTAPRSASVGEKAGKDRPKDDPFATP